MPNCSSLRQLEHRVDSQPLVERKLSASMVIGGHRWLLSLPSTTHTRTATPSKSRACCQPVWPSASTSRVASPRSQNLLRREDYARTVSVGRTTGQHGQWPLSMATVAPTGHFLLGRGLLGRLGTLLRLATRTGSVGHGSVGHQNLKSRRALGVGSARAPGERWKVSTSQYHFVVARWPG